MIPKHIMESKLITDEQWEEYLELKENSTWWSNRFNAVERDKRKLKERIKKAIEYIKNNSLYEEEYDYDFEENIVFRGVYDTTAKNDLIEILGGNNEY